MAKTVLFSFLLFLASACDRYDRTYRELCCIDSLLKKEQNDSALLRINTLSTADIKGESQAYYCLLKTQAQFKTYQPIGSDSIINLSVSYYEQHKDDSKLARALLYKGCYYIESLRFSDAMSCLKKAALLVADNQDYLLKHNIYFYIAHVNSCCHEYRLALAYLRKAIRCSQKANRPDYLAFDYQNSSVYYYNIGLKDSCQLFINKCVTLLDYIPKQHDKTKAQIWNGLGYSYYHIDIIKAKECLGKSIRIYPSGSAYKALAYLSLNSGNKNEAKELLSKGLKCCENVDVQVEINSSLSKIEQELGNYKRAAELSREAYALKDSVARKQQEENIWVQQLSFDMAAERRRAEQRTLWMWMGIACGAIVFVVVACWLWRKVRSLVKETEQGQAIIAGLNSEKKDVERQLKTTQSKVEQLKRARQAQGKALRDMEKKHQKLAQAMEHGHQLYTNLMSGGSISKWQDNDFFNFRTYYYSIEPSFSEYVESHYESLTNSQHLLIMLEHLQKSNDEIIRMMNMTEGALRTARTRLKQKRREERTCRQS